MIPIIKVFDWFIKNFKVVAVSFIMLLTAISFYMYDQIKQKDKEIDRLTTNIEYYQNNYNQSKLDNTVLQLTIDDLTNSKDSLIQQLDSIKKEIKIKDKNLISSAVINSEIKDSVRTVIKSIQKDFTEELKLNKLTTIMVSRKDTILDVKLSLLNQQILFIEDTKVYKKKYKNGFIRFLHFDWRKKHVRKYNIHNTNDLIKVTDSRIVEIVK